MRWKRALKIVALFVLTLAGLGWVGRYALGRLVSQADEVSVRAANAPPTRQMPYDSYWAALEDFEAAAALKLGADAERRAFADAVGLVRQAKLELAMPELQRLRLEAKQPRVRETAAEMLGAILVFVGDWKAYVELAEDEPQLVGDGRLSQGDLIVARALRNEPEELHRFPESPVRLRSDRILSGSPRLKVRVNGKSYRFVIDTGASLSVIAAHVAEACGIEPRGDIGYAETSVSEPVAFRPAVIDKLEIGQWQIEHHPVAILDDQDLEFGLGVVPLIKIDGILGWTLFRDVVFEIDDAAGWTTITAAKRVEELTTVERNFFWLGYPLVVLRDVTGRKLNFGLDTGAAATRLRARGLAKLDIGPTETTTGVTLGAGGRETVVRQKARNVLLYLDDQSLRFDEITTTNGVKGAVLWKPDGQVGINIASGGRMSLDYRNGRFELND